MSKIKDERELYQVLAQKNSSVNSVRRAIEYYCLSEGGIDPEDMWNQYKEYLKTNYHNMYNSIKNEEYVSSGAEMINAPVKTNLNFRYLTANEVEVRPADTRNGKATLLLYKNARVDMSLLDDTVGPMNWQKSYYEEKGMLFCRLGIKDPNSGEWIWKSDTGSMSNIEAEKGLASDAFKRAAFAFGIGRELYTAPRIVIDLTSKDMFNGKCAQSFSVSEMTVDNGIITSLSIVDKWGNLRYTYPSSNASSCDENEITVTEDLPDFEASSSSTSEPSVKTNSNLLKEFCDNKHNDPNVDQYQLGRFWKFYQKPSDKGNGLTIADSFESFDPNMLWDRWMKNARK